MLLQNQGRRHRQVRLEVGVEMSHNQIYVSQDITNLCHDEEVGPLYIEWRAAYLTLNPRLPKTWHVGEKILYKERCFCVDDKEQVRKMGCGTLYNYHDLVVALLGQRHTIFLGDTVIDE